MCFSAHFARPRENYRRVESSYVERFLKCREKKLQVEGVMEL